MRENILRDFVKESMKTNTSNFNFNVGDTVKVITMIKEGKKEREQMFEGLVIAKKGNGIAKNFTVRRVSNGVGVEKVFPIHSPNTKSVEVIRRGRVRRAKLYYLRKKIGKEAKVKELKA